MPTPPTFIQIQRGSQSVPCKGCKAPIYWAPHPSTGRVHPVSVNPELVPGCTEPTATENGRGISHYADCPDRDRFKKTKGAA